MNKKKDSLSDIGIEFGKKVLDLGWFVTKKP